MKFVYIYPVVPTKRFVDGMALKGATLFRLADYDAMRLGHCLKSKIEYLYLDERVEKADPPSGTDLVIIPVNPPAIGRAFEISSHLLKQGLKVLFFGSYPTLRPKLCARYASAIVRGDVTSVIREVIEDMSRNRLKKWYYANRNLSFDVDRVWEDKPGMFPYLSQLRTSFGCSCESGYADFCNEKVLYPEIVSLHEDLIVKSIAGIKKKIIWLQDDDIFYDLNRARYFFKKIWQFKKEWIVQASSRIFLNRDLLLTLSDAGVRIIILKEDWLPCRLFLDSDRMVEVIKLKRRQIDEIHHHRILAGAKIRFDTDLGKSFNFQKIFDLLSSLRVDFLEFSVLTPIPGSRKYKEYKKKGLLLSEDVDAFDHHTPVVRTTVEPHILVETLETLRDRFYSWDSIFIRCARTSSRVGIYNTFLFNLLTNVAYRENLLERAGYPP